MAFWVVVLFRVVVLLLHCIASVWFMALLESGYMFHDEMIPLSNDLVLYRGV